MARKTKAQKFDEFMATQCKGRCAVCGQWVYVSDLIELQGRKICARHVQPANRKG